jgi:choline-sulfatase
MKPANLIFFLSDNHNRRVLGCYGHPVVRTPNLDRIAANGVRFANSYCASPLCCPARASIATGRYPHQTGYWDNAIAYDGRVPSWHHRVREAGHTVVAVGKLHFRSHDDDNGFTEEIETLHLHEGKGAIKNLLRGHDDEQPRGRALWDLYTLRSGPGDTHYHDYDRKITAKAVEWLERHAGASGKPWVLLVSYPSPHPPFTAPKRIHDLYPERDMPLPPRHGPGERSRHPALEHLRRIEGIQDLTDERIVRRVAAGYFGLITHLDEQIGAVMKAVETLGLIGTTRIAYTSDHGELFGAQGILGKKILYEGAIGVPLLLSGPELPAGRVSRQVVSHVDLFPTLLEGAGTGPLREDHDLPGVSLWPAATGNVVTRLGFAEYHAQGSKAGAFTVRDGNMKLIYYVGMPAQLFDLASDPDECRDLAADDRHAATVARLETRLRAILDPEAVDSRAKADQRAMIEHWGGVDKVKEATPVLFTPPPGVSEEEAWAIPNRPA